MLELTNYRVGDVYEVEGGLGNPERVIWSGCKSLLLNFLWEANEEGIREWRD